MIGRVGKALGVERADEVHPPFGDPGPDPVGDAAGQAKIIIFTDPTPICGAGCFHGTI
jgi:hypothetical protein